MKEAAVLQGVSKTIKVGFLGRPKTILTRAEFKVAAGAITGFVGHNGAGKSTTIKLMIGAARPTTGTVQVLGGSPFDPAVRRRLGYLPELPRLPPSLTPHELLTAHARLAGVPSEKLEERVRSLLQKVRLENDARQRTGTFSKGMQQRVGLALALVGEPDLLVLDEPMSGLDPSGRRLVRELLLEQRAQGRAVFLSSHVLPDVEALCDDVIVLHDGRVVAAGPMARIIQGAVRGAEVVFSVGGGEVPDALASLGRIELRGDLHVLRLDAEADVVQAALAVREQGGRVVGIEMLRDHLEDELLRLVDGRAQGEEADP